MLDSADREACVIAADIPRGLLGSYHADCESASTRGEPPLGALASIDWRQSRLIKLGQAFVEASDACVVEVSRFVEPHDDGTRGEFSVAFATPPEEASSAATAAMPTSLADLATQRLIQVSISAILEEVWGAM